MELTVGIENIIITNIPTKKTIIKFIIEKLASIFKPKPSEIYLSTIGIKKKLNPYENMVIKTNKIANCK